MTCAYVADNKSKWPGFSATVHIERRIAGADATFVMSVKLFSMDDHIAVA